MKTVFVAALLLVISNSAFAKPRVGDYVMYDSAYQTSPAVGNIPVTGIFRITAHDKASGLYTYSLQFGTYAPVVETKPLSEIQPVSDTKKTFNECLKLGGTFEKIVVPLGVFDTCRINEIKNGSVSSTWSAKNVPVAVQLSYTGSDKSEAVLKVKSYHWHK